MYDELIPNKIQTVDDIEIPPQILGDVTFTLRYSLMKPYGEAVFTSTKNISTTILEEAAQLLSAHVENELKTRFQGLHRKCESHKEIVFSHIRTEQGPEKTPYLDTFHAVGILHNICIYNRNLVLKKFDLTYDKASNKRRELM